MMCSPVLLGDNMLVVLSVLLLESEYSTSFIGFSIEDNVDNTKSKLHLYITQIS